MDSIHFVRENLQRSESIVLSRIDDMRDHGMTTPTSAGGCHTLWILGHLAYIEGLVISGFMLGEANPLADWEKMFDGEQVCHDHTRLVSFDRALTECRAMRASTVARLDTMTEQDLDRASANAPGGGTDLLFGNYRRCFQYAADHWLMHRGQLANARSAAGLGPMWY